MKQIKIVLATILLLTSFVLSFSANVEESSAQSKKKYAIDCGNRYGTGCQGNGNGCTPDACSGPGIQ